MRPAVVEQNHHVAATCAPENGGSACPVSPMPSDIDPVEEFVPMGTYLLMDARKLLAAFESGGIEHRAEFYDGIANINPAAAGEGGAFGQNAQVIVRVAETQKQEADRIHADLFGNCLPNYDSTFFDDPDNVSDEQV